MDRRLRRLLATALGAVVCGCVSHASAANDRFAPGAPPETRQLEPLLGTWRVTQRSLRPGTTDPTDPAAWQQSAHPAEWRFRVVLGGHAIQDDWISPAPDVDVPPETRSWGTNLRIYNPERRHWEMAWVSTLQREAWEFTATFENGELTMRSVDLDPPRRNVFYDLAPASFRWRQEWSFDGGVTFVPVAYIEAVRVE